MIYSIQISLLGFLLLSAIALGVGSERGGSLESKYCFKLLLENSRLTDLKKPEEFRPLSQSEIVGFLPLSKHYDGKTIFGQPIEPLDGERRVYANVSMDKTQMAVAVRADQPEASSSWEIYYFEADLHTSLDTEAFLEKMLPNNLPENIVIKGISLKDRYKLKVLFQYVDDPERYQVWEFEL